MLPVNPIDKKSALFIANGRRIIITVSIVLLVVIGVLVAIFVF